MFAVDERNHSRAAGFSCPKTRVWGSSIAAVVLGMALLIGPAGAGPDARTRRRRRYGFRAEHEERGSQCVVRSANVFQVSSYESRRVDGIAIVR